MKPITPQECGEQAGSNIPEFVIEAVNNLLQKSYRKGRTVTLRQDDIMAEILRLNINVTREQVFSEGWMDFEPVFERAGWKVTYDKPGYNESYPATFDFKAK